MGEFSGGRPAQGTIKKTFLNDHTFYAYCFPEATTTSVKIVVVSHYNKGNNGAEEIGFLKSGGTCTGAIKEKDGKKIFGTIPNGELPGSTKTKCSANCHARANCKGWNFNKVTLMCTFFSCQGTRHGRPHSCLWR